MGAELGAFGAVWLAFAALVWRFWYVTEDAYISFRYARNLANGEGLRFNLGDHEPVEGYSNFLWCVIGAAVEWSGADQVVVMPMLSLMCGTALLYLVFDGLLKRHPLPVATAASLLFATLPMVAVWTSGGLATMPFALLIFWVFDRLILQEGRGWTAGVLGLLLALLRVEGIFWVIVLAGVCGVVRRDWKVLARYLVIALTGWGIYFAWRYDLYGLPFPNTVYTKVSMSADTLIRGGRYVGSYFVVFLSPIVLLVGGTVLSRDSKAWAAAAMAWGVLLYGVLISGDYMAWFRMLLPVAAFQTVVGGVLLQWVYERTRAGVIALVTVLVGLQLAPAVDLNIVPAPIRAELDFRYTLGNGLTEYQAWETDLLMQNNMRERGLALKEYSLPGDSLVIRGVGNIGYYSDMFIYDCYGLTNRAVTTTVEPQLGSPGHDKAVDRTWFVKNGYEPTIVHVRVYSGPKALDQIARQMRAWEYKREYAPFREDYGPDFRKLESQPFKTRGEDTYLLVLRRGDKPRQLYARARRRLKKIRTEGS